MSTDTVFNQPPVVESCSEHGQIAKWQCGFCGKAVCQDCKPIGYNYQVFHPVCLPKAQEKVTEKIKAHGDIEAPSLGVKIIAWTFIVIGIVAFGVTLLLLGFAWLGHALPIRALLSGPVVPNLDSIPGGRALLFWVAGFSFVASGGSILAGGGLLNCVESIRRFLLLVAWLEVVVAILGWLGVLLLGHGFWDIPVIGVCLILFFTRQSVKRQFEKVL